MPERASGCDAARLLGSSGSAGIAGPKSSSHRRAGSSPPSSLSLDQIGSAPRQILHLEYAKYSTWAMGGDPSWPHNMSVPSNTDLIKGASDGTAAPIRAGQDSHP